MAALGIFTVDPEAPFVDAIAEAWFEAAGRDPVRNGDGLIAVPTRRAARTLAEAFLHVGESGGVSGSGGGALLLPRIEAIGGADESGYALGLGFELPPAIEPMQRLACLARLVMRSAGEGAIDADGAWAKSADRAWALAVELASLIDEAAREGVELADALAGVAPAELASHWQVTLDFLAIVTRAWPAQLDAIGMIDPARRHARLLDATALAWTETPPAHAVWLVGIADATPSLARLAGAIARMPSGRVVLPGLDRELSKESWAALDDTHPQAGMRLLLDRIGAVREDVLLLAQGGRLLAQGGRVLAGGAPAARVALLRRALLPAVDVARVWRDGAGQDISGLSLLEARDAQSEAVAIAVALRHAIETPGRRAALVTPDRGLARRVAAEIARFGIVADDSAGEPLGETPPGMLLRLLAQAVIEGLPPATLLALVKHPFAALGLPRAPARQGARSLERLCLRGPRPAPGIDGLRANLVRAEAGAGSKARIGDADRTGLAAWLDRLEFCLAPLDVVAGGPLATAGALLDGLVEAAERLCDDPDHDNGSRLWAGEDGEALSAHVAALDAAFSVLDPVAPSALPGLFEATLQGITVHGRRALRGRDALEIHPRVAIWGLLEARGQSADLIVLGGLTEGVWPSPGAPGPWMGRNMRASVGLPSAEIAVGAAAHDFVRACLAAPEVILSAPRLRDHAPAVPSRWIARIEACLRGAGMELARHPAAEWAAALDQPAGAPVPALPPRPCPPVALRPRALSVTAIGTWLCDPYAIYAARILKLPVLAALEEEADHALFGNVVHAGLSEAYGRDTLDADGIKDALHAALAGVGVREGVASWWRPRLDRIASWVAREEQTRRRAGLPSALATETGGKTTIGGPAGPFTLTGRADRIEVAPDGRLAILDYKTGTPPSRKDVEAGWAPQLPLEATMAALGGFGEAFRGRAVGELAHWKLSGGVQPGEAIAIVAGGRTDLDMIVADAWHGLEMRIAAFDDPATPYLSQPLAAHAPRFDEYGVLARVAEWRRSGGADPDEGGGGS